MGDCSRGREILRIPYFGSAWVIIFAPIFVLIVNTSIVIIIGVSRYDEIGADNIMHFLGGAAATMFSAGILWRLMQCKIIRIVNIYCFRLLVLGMLSAIIMSWEILEYILQATGYLSYWLGQLTYTDTVTDMILGLIGGTLVIFTIKRSDLHNLVNTEGVSK